MAWLMVGGMVERDGSGGFEQALTHTEGDGAGQAVEIRAEVACGVAQGCGCGIGHCKAGGFFRGAVVDAMNQTRLRGCDLALAVTVDVSAGVGRICG